MKKNIFLITLFIILLVSLTGCNNMNSIKLKLGMINNDFEYFNQGKVRKIIIQNNRDKGFKFIVTDKNAISEIYDILKTAKPVAEKSNLKADYTFEMYESEQQVYKFNYIVGIGKNDGGNFYSDDKTYIVSDHLENDIIMNFFDIRMPKEFNKVYYQSIIKTIDLYQKEHGSNAKIAININDDIDASKFVLSTDLEEFKKKIYDNTYILEGDKAQDDTLMSIDTFGYKSWAYNEKVYSKYKAIVTFTDKANSEKKYYIDDEYNDEDGWKYNISNKMQNDFN